jgi:hypothetical protein
MYGLCGSRWGSYVTWWFLPAAVKCWVALPTGFARPSWPPQVAAIVSKVMCFCVGGRARASGDQNDPDFSASRKILVAITKLFSFLGGRSLLCVALLQLCRRVM